ncbi:type II toxin-antitoxin system YhaV family toxin [Tardiphaga alba]|uniref:Type II toxin-antitoxin system YhaV family toxin n=1 Tax=Tardiphaga alba TaxID=340268 RepID=A0ABX8AFQ8_9BRAD|nr:type II toxin-antitoxin system YhaV family toxin [Tardiphaga alba]QUS41215.1 type II toxin-antitoxin system YhaV family toxin [Tardiphaga alba]
MIINGWSIYAHPLFLNQVTRLVEGVERDRIKDPTSYQARPNAKLLKAIRTITQERIPHDPTDRRYRLGSTLGSSHKHWFRDKFGNSRFRLFFRFDMKAKVIVYAWVNDETTLRTYGKKTDAYAVFTSMLTDGNPPDSWDNLLASCSDPEIVAKAAALLKNNSD